MFFTFYKARLYTDPGQAKKITFDRL
jgi:hypothetical protein